MDKSTKVISYETIEAIDNENMHAPPGVAYTGDGSVHIDWVTAHHIEDAAWMGDNVVNPDN